MKDTINSYVGSTFSTIKEVKDLLHKKVRFPTQEVSEMVQKKLFKLGFSWNGKKEVKNFSFFLFLNYFDLKHCGDNESYYLSEPDKEIDYHDILGVKE